MSRSPIPSAYYALVVARWEERFLIIQERKGHQPWYLPAGRVEPGESLTDGAIRETLEESGVEVRLTGLLALEHEAWPDRTRVRAVFTAEPLGDPTPLAFPGNEHAVQAGWVSRAEAAALPLRSPEVLTWFQLADEGPVTPLTILQSRSLPGHDVAGT